MEHVRRGDRALDDGGYKSITGSRIVKQGTMPKYRKVSKTYTQENALRKMRIKITTSGNEVYIKVYG